MTNALMYYSSPAGVANYFNVFINRDEKKLMNRVTHPIIENFSYVQLNEAEPTVDYTTFVDLGVGLSTVAMQQLKPQELIAIDGSELMLERMQAEYPSPFTQYKHTDFLTGKLPVKSGSVQVVNCTGVFHLMPSIENLLREAARILEPDGCLVFTAMYHGDDVNVIESWNASSLDRTMYVHSLHSMNALTKEIGLSRLRRFDHKKLGSQNNVVIERATFVYRKIGFIEIASSGQECNFQKCS